MKLISREEDSRMKKKIIIATLLLMAVLTACGKESGSTENDLDSVEHMEGYEGLSEEETNQKLIEEADKMEVVPDKTE